jgi:glycosyltransferase involved in cell wall biosynthesis
MTMKEICIIIPFYNETTRFPLEEFKDFLQKDKETTFCLVNDGSTDNTGKMLESLREQFPLRILIVTLSINKGKAVAVQEGINMALQNFTCCYFGYFDADLSTQLEEAYHLRSKIQEKNSLQAVFGSRVAILGVRIERKLYRHLIGRIIATFISNILHFKVYDTQCGAKLFTRELAVSVFEKPFITRWLFDVEILARILGLYNRDHIEEIVVEVPVNSWIDKGKSKVSWIYGFRVFYDLMRIRTHYKDFL